MSRRVKLTMAQNFPHLREDLRIYHVFTSRGAQRIAALDSVDALREAQRDDREVIFLYD